jgi:hypothetical protein
MGWLKKIFSPIQKAIDPLLPESVKKIAAKADVLNLGIDPLLGVQNPKNDAPAAAAASASDAGPAAPAITPEEAETLSTKRLARLGRYFTSPLGVLSGASTGSQKVFS